MQQSSKPQANLWVWVSRTSSTGVVYKLVCAELSALRYAATLLFLVQGGQPEQKCTCAQKL
jgi:hypothetical protein